MQTITSSETTMDPQAVLSLTKGVMRESYNPTDSVCKFLHKPTLLLCLLACPCLLNLQLSMILLVQPPSH